jgi:hypothetical protein
MFCAIHRAGQLYSSEDEIQPETEYFVESTVPQEDTAEEEVRCMV